jgi:mono/diheme cytochrome c family protein
MDARNKELNGMRYIILGLFIIMFCITGCYYDRANLVYPQATCTVTKVTYTTSVTGILRTGCYNCHSGNASTGGGIILDSYTSLHTYVTNGQLMNSIKHTGGIPGMPLNANQLSACDINTIQTWINDGAINN